MKDLKDKNCVLTGASSGIGRSLALELAQEGTNLFLVDLDEVGLEKVKQEIEPLGIKVYTTKCDVSKYEDIERMASEAYSKLGEIDLLINNAGISGGGAIEMLELEEWKRVIDVNLWSIIFSIKVFLPKMIERRAGHIVNTASGAGIVGLPFHPHYVASKAAVVGITEALSSELSKLGLKFSAICPSFIKTSIIDRSIIKVPRHLIEGDNLGEVDEKLEGFKEAFWEEYMREGKTPEEVAKKYLKGIKKEDLFIFDSRIVRLALFLKAISQRLYNRALRGQGKEKLEMIETALNKLGLKLKDPRVELKKGRKKLKGKTCLLTGAACGIGRALAFELAKKGVNLYLADIQIENLEKVKADLEPYGVQVYTGKCDVANFEDFQRLAEEVYSKFGELDIIINNAGIGGGGYCEDMTIEEWKRVLDINLWSIIYAIKIFIPKFLERGEGYFVNTGSAAGIIGLPYHIEYVASKFAVVGLSEALYSELNMRGIDVSVICPSFIKSNIMDRSEVMLPQRLIIGATEEEINEKRAKFKEAFGKYYFEGGITPEKAAKSYIKGLKKRKLYIFDKFLIPFARFVKGISEGLYKRVLGRVKRQDLEVIEKALTEAGIEYGDLIY